MWSWRPQTARLSSAALQPKRSPSGHCAEPPHAGAPHAFRTRTCRSLVPMLQGIAFFVRSLPAGRAAAVQAAVEAVAATHEPSQVRGQAHALLRG